MTTMMAAVLEFLKKYFREILIALFSSLFTMLIITHMFVFTVAVLVMGLAVFIINKDGELF